MKREFITLQGLQTLHQGEIRRGLQALKGLQSCADSALMCPFILLLKSLNRLFLKIWPSFLNGNP